MYAIAPLNTIRFGFSDRQYSLGAREESGPGTRLLRGILQRVLPYTLQETTPAQQTLFPPHDEPVRFYYMADADRPGQYKLYLNA